MLCIVSIDPFVSMPSCEKRQVILCAVSIHPLKIMSDCDGIKDYYAADGVLDNGNSTRRT